MIAYQIIDIGQLVFCQQLHMIGTKVLLLVATVIADCPLSRFVVDVCYERSNCKEKLILFSVTKPVFDSDATV